VLPGSPLRMSPGTGLRSTAGITLNVTGALVTAPKPLLIITEYAPACESETLNSCRLELVALNNPLQLKYHWYNNGESPPARAPSPTVEPASAV